MSSIEYRHPVEEDIEDIVSAQNESCRELPFFREETVQEWRAWSWDEPDYDPEGYLVAVIDGDIVGYGGAKIVKSRLEHGFNDAYVQIDVMPEHRGKGIEQHLMSSALEFLRSRDIAYARRWCDGTEGWRHDFTRDFGFRDVRHFYNMQWKSESPPEVFPPPDSIRFETMMMKDASDETVAKFTDIKNRSFADHWNSSPMTLERAIVWRDTEEEITRLCFAIDGDDIVGLSLMEESAAFNKENGTNVGWADLLGVMPEHRGQGIGRALLSEGMRWIWDRGMDTINLGVDGKNEKALVLYKSLGFRVNNESIQYVLDL